jgi:tetratricopeptide (TPR) repeat protein
VALFRACRPLGPSLQWSRTLFESNLHSDAATLIGSDGDVVLGLRLLDEAAAAGKLLSPAAHARIAAEQAQALAALKLGRESQEAMDRAKRAVEDIDGSDRAGLFSDWSATRLVVYEGTCQVLLGDAKAAVHTLQRALRASDDGNANVTLAAKVDLASALVEAGELEEGCRVLGDTYEQLVTTGNHRGIERAKRARKRFAEHVTQGPVRALDERIRSVDRQ